MPVPSRLAPVAVAIALGASACSQYTSTAGPEHCGAINDEVWGKDLNPHDVTCDVTVTGDLVIGPGTRVRFAPGVALIVQGTLSVEGTAERPVIMEEAEDGRGWVGIWVRAGSDSETAQRPEPGALPPAPTLGDVQISHATLKGAGITPEGASFRAAALILERGPVDLVDVTIDNARQCGISLGEGGRIGADTTNLVITGSNEAPICSHAAAVSSLPTEGMTLDDGTTIDVFGDRITGAHTWTDLGHTYRITNDLEIERGELTLGAGVDVALVAGTRITVGGSNGGVTYGEKRVTAENPFIREEAARLHIAGEAANPVTFDVDGGAGTWDRLRVVGSSNAKVSASAVIENAVFNHGGAGSDVEPTTLEATGDADLTLIGVSILDGGGAGLLLDDGAVLSEDSTGLTISGNAYPVVTHPDGALTLPKAGSSYTGNGQPQSAGSREPTDAIYLFEGGFSESGTLQDLGVPYRLDGDLQTAGGVEDDFLVIEDGVEVQVPGAAEIRLGTNAALRVSIGASGGTGVLFTGIEGQGLWDSLTLGSSIQDTEEETSAIYNLTVEGAGRLGSSAAVDFIANDLLVEGLLIDGTDGTETDETPGLRLSGTFAEGSSNLVVRNASGPAVFATTDSAASLPKPGVDLSSNGVWSYVFVDGNRVSQTGTWNNLGVPYRVESLVEVKGSRDRDGNPDQGARLTVEAGTVIEFGVRGGLRTDRLDGSGPPNDVNGALHMEGTPEAPIILRGVDREAGWSNVWLYWEDDMPDGQQSVLHNVEIYDAGAIFANASLEMWSSTPSLQNITIEHGFRRGVALQWDAFVEDRADQSEIACDYWTYDDVISEFTFSDICINQSEIPVADCPLLDFRVFLSTDAEYCAD